MKWNESGFRPPLCTYRLNWARRTSWGWWDDWDDTVLQTQDSKFEPWRSEAEHATSRPQYWLSHVDGEETFFVFLKSPRPGTEPRTLAWKAAVLTTTLGPPPPRCRRLDHSSWDAKWCVNPHLAKLFYLNFLPFKVIYHYRHPQPQVIEKYSYLFNLRPNINKFRCSNTNLVV